MIYNLNSHIFSLLKLTTSVTHIRCRAVTWKIHEKSALESPKVTRTSLAENKCTELATPFACVQHTMQRAHVIQSKDQPGALQVQGQNYGEKDSKRLKSSKSRKVEHQTTFLDVPWLFFGTVTFWLVAQKVHFLTFALVREKMRKVYILTLGGFELQASLK